MTFKYLANTAVLATTMMLLACSEPVSTDASQMTSAPSDAPTSLADQHPDHAFAFLLGEWVGTATGRSAEGPYSVIQTERVGLMLDGDLVIVNGTGYLDDGTVAFEAFGIISKTPDGQGWQMRSYNDGREGTFPITLEGSSYSWVMPAGPDATMEFQATIDGDNWVSTGHYRREGMDPMETFRMTLTRQGPTDWPAAAPVTYE